MIALAAGLDAPFAETCRGVPEAVSCDAVCRRIVVDCVGRAPGDPEAEAEIAACTRECAAEDPSDAQLTCGLTVACEDTERCGAERDPDVELLRVCGQVCDNLAACVDRDDRGVCLDECAREWTPGFRACVVDAGPACEAIEVCGAGEDADPALVAECGAACDALSPCFDGEVTPAQCVAGCVAESTPAQRACVLADGFQCADLELCDEGGVPDPDVRAECSRLCRALVPACFEVPREGLEAEIAECTAGCTAESTPAERACLDEALPACDQVEACFGE